MSNVTMITENLKNIPWQEKPEGYVGPVWRYSENPIVGRNPIPGVARIFNSAVVPYEGEFIGVFRAEQNDGVPHLYLGAARMRSTGSLRKRRYRWLMRQASLICRAMLTTRAL